MSSPLSSSQQSVEIEAVMGGPLGAALSGKVEEAAWPSAKLRGDPYRLVDVAVDARPPAVVIEASLAAKDREIVALHEKVGGRAGMQGGA